MLYVDKPLLKIYQKKLSGLLDALLAGNEYNKTHKPSDSELESIRIRM